MATKGGGIDFMFLAPTRPLDPLLRCDARGHCCEISIGRNISKSLYLSGPRIWWGLTRHEDHGRQDPSVTSGGLKIFREEGLELPKTAHKTIILQNFCQKLHENERIRIKRGCPLDTRLVAQEVIQNKLFGVTNKLCY